MMRDLLVCVVGITLGTSLALAADPGPFHQELRNLGLYAIAEAEAWHVLRDPRLSSVERLDWTVELSRTLTAHALATNPESRAVLWDRTRQAFDEASEKLAPAERFLLELQQHLLAVTQAQDAYWYHKCHSAAPFAALPSLNQAAHQLQHWLDTATKRRTAEHALPEVRFRLAQLWMQHADLCELGSANRATSVNAAEQALRGAATDEPEAVLGLKRAVARLKKGPPAVELSQPETATMSSALATQHVYDLLAANRPDGALEALQSRERSHPPLSGEQRWQQLMAFAGARELALQKQDLPLAAELLDLAAAVQQRSEREVSPEWVWRCRALWESVVNGRTYNSTTPQQQTPAMQDPLLDDAKLQQAFAANDWSAAAALLLQASQRPAEPAQCAQWHWQACVALGRVYANDPTRAAREAYVEQLVAHRAQFPEATTVAEANFWHARLEEGRRQLRRALELYRDISVSSAWASERHAGLARCWYGILLRLTDDPAGTRHWRGVALEELTPAMQPLLVNETSDLATLEAMAYWRLLDADSPAACEWLAQLVAECLRRHRLGTTAVSDQPRLENVLMMSLKGAWLNLPQDQLAASLATARESAQRLPEHGGIVLNLWATAVQEREIPRDVARDAIAAVRELPPIAAPSPDEQRVRALLLLVAAVLARDDGQAVLHAQSLRQSLQGNAVGARQVALWCDRSDALAVRSEASLCWQQCEALAKPETPAWWEARRSQLLALVAAGRRADATTLWRLTQQLYPNWKQRPELQAVSQVIEQGP